MDIQKIAVGVCAVGTACVVGGTAVVDQVTNGSVKRKSATVEAVVEELKPFIKEQIEIKFSTIHWWRLDHNNLKLIIGKK